MYLKLQNKNSYYGTEIWIDRSVEVNDSSETDLSTYKNVIYDKCIKYPKGNY
jgi:hypothetical protein